MSFFLHVGMLFKAKMITSGYLPGFERQKRRRFPFEGDLQIHLCLYVKKMNFCPIGPFKIYYLKKDLNF